MEEQMVIQCPNCGSLAQCLLRDCLPTGQKFPAKQLTRTTCLVCDYFMVISWQGGRVIEAYVPAGQENFSQAQQ